MDDKIKIKTGELTAKNVRPLEIVNKRDTLIVVYQDSDCGEWGGHRETIFLQRQNNGKISATILIDKVPCNAIIEKNGVGGLDPEKREIIVDYTIVLELKDEQIFNEFLRRLFELYLKPSDGPANFGSYYLVKNTDKSLFFSYWNTGDLMDTRYGILKKEVFGELK